MCHRPTSTHSHSPVTHSLQILLFYVRSWRKVLASRRSSFPSDILAVTVCALISSFFSLQVAFFSLRLTWETFVRLVLSHVTLSKWKKKRRPNQTRWHNIHWNVREKVASTCVLSDIPSLPLYVTFWMILRIFIHTCTQRKSNSHHLSLGKYIVMNDSLTI